MKAKPFQLLASLLVLGSAPFSDGETGGAGPEGKPYYHETQMPGRYRQWRVAEDGPLSVHLTAGKTTFTAAEGITLRCVVRNHSDKPVTILSPFGDEDYAHSSGLNMLGPDGPVAYNGPQKEYALSRDAFVEVPAKSVIEGSLTIPKDQFPGIDKPGLYVIDYGYVSRGYPTQQPPANFWTGGVHTNPVTVVVK